MTASGFSSDSRILQKHFDKYPSADAVSHLVHLIKTKGDSAEETISPLAHEILVRTAQIVASYPQSGDSSGAQYEWLKRQASTLAGDDCDAKHLVQTSKEIHNYIFNHYKIPLTGNGDTDSTVLTFLGAARPTVEGKITRAKHLLETFENIDVMNSIIYDLTGNCSSHTPAQKTSHFLSLLKEIGVEDELSKKSRNPGRIAEALTIFHTSSLEHARIQLYQKLPDPVKAAVFPDYPAASSDIEKAAYIKRMFDSTDHTKFESVTWLVLKSRGIRILPKEITNCANLQELQLCKNKLWSLPKWFVKLSHLQCLFLQENKLTLLPELFEQHSSLLCLNLNKNKLTFLPATIDRIRCLETLKIENNKLSSLPLSFNTLSRLKWLFLRGNNFEIYPHYLKAFDEHLEKRLYFDSIIPFEESLSDSMPPRFVFA